MARSNAGHDHLVLGWVLFAAFFSVIVSAQGDARSVIPGPGSRMRGYLIALIVAFFLVLVSGVLPSNAAVSFSGGNTGIVGDWLSISLTTGLGSDATLAYGTTYTQVLGLEPLLSITGRGTLPDGWNVE